MKKIHYLLMTAVAALVAFTACRKEPEQQTDPNAFGKFKLSEIVDAASTAYKAWEESEAFPESFTLGDKTATIAQYQNAICQALVNISAGKTDDITVITVKPADHPERDSYDKETIAIANGPKNGDETEDLVNVAKRMIERMTKELKVPNQTNFTRNGSAIAFSTDRATIVISRALANYKKDGKLGESIDAGYKGASNTLKAFAKELVKYLDIWEKTVGTVDADGSHCTSNNTAWENVHFIPIEYSGGYKDGTMYSEYYQPYYHVKVDNKEYTSAECWSIAAQGIMDLVTLEGSSLMQPTRNPFIHTLGNGKTLDEPIPTPAEYVITTGWGKWPWYENTNDGGKVINFSESHPCTVEFLAHELGWYLTRCTTLDPPAIGNFQEFGTSESTINFNGYVGQISAMRTFLIMIRFYDYLLKNNITENVWDAVKDVHLNYDLYGVDMPDIELVTSKLEFDCVEETKEAKFSAKKAWTATATESWITVEPSSGEAGDIALKITCAANSGDAREGKVIVKGGNVTDGLEIVVKQEKYTEPVTATIKDFAQEYIKVIDQWATHVGTINRLSNWELAKDGDKDVVENAHYIPNDFTISVGVKTFKTGDMLELALRSYLLLRGWDGNETELAGLGKIPTTTPVDINAPLPKAHDFTFGSPLIETSNGGYFCMIVNGQEVYGQADLKVLDNWAQRALNWPFTHDKVHSNLCGYSSGQLEGYGGCFSSGRALLTFAFFFKYMLENGLEKADNLGADVIIRSELFGLETAVEEKYTIKDFAQQYVKIINIWESNVGTINRLSNWELAKTGDNDIVENAHYVPSNTTILVGNNVFTTGDMLELALRSYLLLRGWDGNETEKAGLGKIPTTTPVDINAPLPEAHGFTFGSPLIETSNGGYFCKKVNGEDVYGQADTKVLDNWAQRALNWPFTHDKVHSNLCGYSSGQLEGYGGCFSSGRALLTYAFFFKYMLDNNLEKADGIGSDVAIRSELFGLETAKTPTLKDFAKEFVKGLEVWENTVGTVESESDHLIEKGAAWENVHFIPIVPNPSCEYLNHAGNQYDPKWASKIWKLKVGGTEYSSSQAWEIAIRGLLNMCTAEGEAFLEGMTDRNKAYTVQDGLALSKAPISEPSKDNKWGKHPWYEDGSLVKDGGKEISEVGIDFMLKVGAWHVVRSFIPAGSNKPLGMIGNYQEFGTSSGSLNLKGDNGDYVGLISAMRELMVMMRIYKYLLDNNIDSNVYSAIKDKKFDFDLYGESPAPAASIKIDGDLSDWDAIDAQAGTGDRITEWKITSDADNIYLYFKVPNSVAKSRGKWNAYLVAAFDTDNNSATGSDAGYGLGSDYEALTVTFPFSNASGEDPVLANEAISDSKIECPIGTKVDTLGSMGKVSGDSSLIEYSIPRAKIGSPASGSTIGVRVGMASQSIPAKVQITLN